MQLKEAYQRRIQDQKNHQSQIAKKKKENPIPIGSIRLGRNNFHVEDRIFTQYKVRDSIKNAKKQIREQANPDILDLKKKKWNISNSAPRSFQKFQKEESQRQKLLKIRLGFNDFGLVTCKKPCKIYEGTQSRDSFLNWNVSTFVTKKQKDDGQQITNLNAYDNSIKRNSKLQNYQKPTQRYKEALVKDRQQFSSQSQVLEDFKKSFIYNNPNSSPEKLQAVTLKFFDENKRQSRKKQIQDYDTKDSFGSNFKAKLSKSQKQKITYHYFHTGKWQMIDRGRKKNSDGYSSDEEQYYWSCCMNSQKNSRGCAKRLIDGNRYNFSSFNNL